MKRTLIIKQSASTDCYTPVIPTCVHLVYEPMTYYYDLSAGLFRMFPPSGRHKAKETPKRKCLRWPTSYVRDETTEELRKKFCL